jgi:uncharacterized protein YecT (DUF1311 family)
MKRAFAFALLLCCGIPPSRADDSVLPAGWNPTVQDEVAYLDDELKAETAQQEMNRLSGYEAGILDADLLVTYVRLWEKLPAKARPALKEEQARWMKKRLHDAAEAAKSEEGGTISTLTGNVAFANITRKRIEELEGRLKKTTH